MTPVDVRDHLVDISRQDLVGPALPGELLVPAPTGWYPMGFLTPRNASPSPSGQELGVRGLSSVWLTRVAAFAGRYA